MNGRPVSAGEYRPATLVELFDPPGDNQVPPTGERRWVSSSRLGRDHRRGRPSGRPSETARPAGSSHARIARLGTRALAFNGLQLMALSSRPIPTIVMTGFPDLVLEAETRQAGRAVPAQTNRPERPADARQGSAERPVVIRVSPGSPTLARTDPAGIDSTDAVHARQGGSAVSLNPRCPDCVQAGVFIEPPYRLWDR